MGRLLESKHDIEGKLSLSEGVRMFAELTTVSDDPMNEEELAGPMTKLATEALTHYCRDVIPKELDQLSETIDAYKTWRNNSSDLIS